MSRSHPVAVIQSSVCVLVCPCLCISTHASSLSVALHNEGKKNCQAVCVVFIQQKTLSLNLTVITVKNSDGALRRRGRGWGLGGGRLVRTELSEGNGA